jgi:hypothetical protein
MNKARRAEIAKAVELLNEAKGIIETCATDERTYYEAMPENMQNGDKGNAASEAADTLETAVDEIDSVVSNLEGVA